MFGSNKAGAVILAWGALVLLSIVLAPFYTIFAGVVLGAVLTAGTLTLVVKWSIEDMFTETTGNIEQMNEALSNADPITEPEDDGDR